MKKAICAGYHKEYEICINRIECSKALRNVLIIIKSVQNTDKKQNAVTSEPGSSYATAFSLEADK